MSLVRAQQPEPNHKHYTNATFRGILFFMTQVPGVKAESNLSITIGESVVSTELPFSLVWLQAVDPRAFTPQTWENGRDTTIRLRAADGSIRVNVYRAVSLYRADNEIELKDEAYALEPGETEAGGHDISQFRYKFDEAGTLTDFNPTLTLTERMQNIVTALSGLVTISGSTISASNYRTGRESNFVSDGMQWIEASTGIIAPTYPAFAVGRLALDQPSPE